jgi:hypothetical protein
MNVHLDPRTKKELDALADAEGKAPEALLRELVHAAHEARARNGAPSSEDEEGAAKQRRALEDLIEELDALPSEGLPAPEGRPVSENVDEYLYGWNK